MIRPVVTIVMTIRHHRIISVNEHNPKQPKSLASTMPQICLDWRDRQQSLAPLAAVNRQVSRVRT
jgi:hypothetical protein